MAIIRLTKGMAATVDVENVETLSRYSWHATNHDGQTYAATRLRDEKQTYIYMHRMIMNALPNEEIDHKNGNGLDNRRANLRRCTSGQNKVNRPQQSNNRTSRYKGVCFDKVKRLWTAQLKVGARRYIKRFHSENEAARYYNQIAEQEFGEFARLNSLCNEDRHSKAGL